MGRFERNTELDENGVFAIGHTVTDTETGDQEHFGVDGLTSVGRSISDGDGHSTQMSPDGYTALGHTDTDDDDDSTHTDDEQVMAVGHTDHQPGKDVHMDVERVSSRGSSVPGGSSGFQHFYGSGSEDESASDNGHRGGSGSSSSRDSDSDYDSDGDYDSDYDSSGSAPQEAPERTVPSGVETRWETWNDNYGYPIVVEVWYELQRDGHGNSVYTPRLVDPDMVRRQSEESAARRDSEESAFEEPAEEASCHMTDGEKIFAVILGAIGVAGLVAALGVLVYTLGKRDESSAHTPASTPTTENDVQKTLDEAAGLGFDEIERQLDQLILQRRSERAVRQAVSGASAAPAAVQYAAPSQPIYTPPPRAPEPRPTARTPRVRPEDVRTHIRHPVTSDVESARERVRHGLREWNPGLSNAELRARAGSLAPLFEDTPPSSPSLTDRIHSIRVPPVPPYEGPKWKVRTEPKREQYVPQPMQNWARQRR